MDIVITPTNHGLFAVSLAKLRSIGVKGSAQVRGKSCKISTFSRKSRNNFKRQLQTTAFNSAATWSATLHFAEETSPRRAKEQFYRFVKWLRRLLPELYGFYTVEFRRSNSIHYHLVLCPHRSRKYVCDEYRLKASREWERIAFLPPSDLIYLEPVESLTGWLGYLVKMDEQRVIPPQFKGQMTRYWGRFGKVEKNHSQQLTIRDDLLPSLRHFIADLVAEQGGSRSGAYAAALRHSTGAVVAYISSAQRDELLLHFARFYG